MKIDTFIKCGANHNVCEDYILSGMLPIPYIIISDGCSSSDNTEIGARILCHLAKQYINYRADYLVDDLNIEDMGNWIAHNAELISRQLGLPTRCLDATLIVAIANEFQIQIVFFGDGFVYSIGKDDSVIISNLDQIKYEQNAPYYLSYRIDPFRANLYHQMRNNIKIVTKYEINGDIKSVENDESLFAYDMPIFLKFDRKKFSSIFISSDGLESFIVPHLEGQIKIDPFSLMKDEFSQLKNTVGEFLKRRCKRAISNLEKEREIIHYDDFSIGAFLLGD